MRTIYLVRHGKVEFPGGIRRCIGRTDLPLDFAGRKQAEDLEEYFRNRPVEAVYCSPLMRSLETARILAGDKLPVVMVKGLMELNMGEWENLPLSDLVKDLESEPARGEGRRQGQKRMNDAIGRILEETCGDVVIVAHAGVNCAYLAGVLGQPLSTSRGITQPYGGISRIFVDGQGRFYGADLGKKPKAAPCDRECGDIWEHYRTPEPVMRHCQAVMRQAEELGKALAQAGVPLDRKLIRSSALLHDVVRDRKNHAWEGARVLVREGYPLAAAVIRQHHELEGDALDEAAVVFLADKWVQGESLVSLEERFGRTRARCVKNPEALAAHERRYRQAKAIEDKMKQWRPCLKTG